MGQNLQVSQAQDEIVERLITAGDLSKLSPADRTKYYTAVCQSVGLNPLTRPFAYLSLNGKLVLYALKDCTEQLRKIHNVSLEIIEKTNIDGVFIVTARARMPNGRADESTGAVTITNLKGDALANALMKAETKAKRRVTLSICGLGWLDESEVETIPGAQPVEHPAPVRQLAAVPEREEVIEAEDSAEPNIENAQEVRTTLENEIKDLVMSMGHTKRALDGWVMKKYQIPDGLQGLFLSLGMDAYLDELVKIRDEFRANLEAMRSMTASHQD